MSLGSHPLHKFLRTELLPTAFCPGCGNGVVAGALLRAIEELGYSDLRKFVFVSGIGCAAWIPSPYFKADTVHTLHGRAIPVAEGIKLVRPDLEVIVIGGDGDIAGIGGNHLVHAARRNMDLLVIMVNNFIYAMTGGQLAPTTPLGFKTTTTPYGNPEPPLDACQLVASLGANYVARWTIMHFDQLKESIKKALKLGKGFRFIEVVSQCTSRVSARMGMRPSEFMKWLIKNSIPVNKASELSLEERWGKIIVGEYVYSERPGFIEVMKKTLSRFRKGA